MLPTNSTNKEIKSVTILHQNGTKIRHAILTELGLKASKEIKQKLEAHIVDYVAVLQMTQPDPDGYDDLVYSFSFHNALQHFKNLLGKCNFSAAKTLFGEFNFKNEDRPKFVVLN